MPGGRQSARDWIDADEPDGHSFPLWVTFGSLLLALLLFFSSTAPALRERDDLGQIHDEVERLRASLEATFASVRAGVATERRQADLQALLVAIDRLGFTPAELLQQIPEPRTADPQAGQATEAPAVGAAGRRR